MSGGTEKKLPQPAKDTPWKNLQLEWYLMVKE